MKPILSIETSVPTARVAVLDGDGRRLSGADKVAERHSSHLLRLVDEALTAAGVGLPDLGGIACGGGPGSFTGLRVGLSVAKGLALPTGLPLVVVSSLAALAVDLAAAVVGPGTRLLVACIDAGKEQIYAQGFRHEHDLITSALPEAAIFPRDLGRWLISAGLGGDDIDGAEVTVGGTGFDRYAEILRATLPRASFVAAVPGPSALSVGRLALPRLAAGDADDLERAVPSYGRPPDITKPRS